MIVTERIATGRDSRDSRDNGRNDVGAGGKPGPSHGGGPGSVLPAGVGVDTGGALALVVPATGEIRAIAWDTDVAALARREIDCQVVQPPRLGPTLLGRGVQIWLDGNGPATPGPINPRAGALALACLPRQCGPARALRELFVGAVLLCAGPDTGDNPLGLHPAAAQILTWAANNLEPRATRRRGIGGGRA